MATKYKLYVICLFTLIDNFVLHDCACALTLTHVLHLQVLIGADTRVRAEVIGGYEVTERASPSHTRRTRSRASAGGTGSGGHGLVRAREGFAASEEGVGYTEALGGVWTGDETGVSLADSHCGAESSGQNRLQVY